MDWEARRALDAGHLADPEVGDYWHDMFSPVCVVVGRREGAAVVCEHTKVTDPDHWTWDLSRLRWVTLAEFARWLTFQGESMAGRTWCHVLPRAHEWARDAARVEMFGDLPGDATPVP